MAGVQCNMSATPGWLPAGCWLLAVWLSGCLAVWLSGCLAVWLSGWLSAGSKSGAVREDEAPAVLQPRHCY